jgi:hypothetical protein
MLLLNLIPLIDVTFSTPTGDCTTLRRLFAPSLVRDSILDRAGGSRIFPEV